MSRYVWKVSEASFTPTYTTNAKGKDLRYISSDDYIILAESATFNAFDGNYTLGGSVKATKASEFTLASTRTYPYLATESSESKRTIPNVFMSVNGSGYWRTKSDVTVYCDDETRWYYQKSQAGDFLGYVSSDSLETYPDGGVYRAYYYKAIVADNIDPTAVTIPSGINGGESTQAVVTESVSGTLHSYGTIKYQYQYQINNGSWQDIKTSESASETFTVPSGANTIRVRVRVQDSLGYVQPDWVYSGTVEVFNNQPPSAPGSIRAENVVSGKYATITITSATDSDGYIAEYIYERSVDGGSWSQAARSGSLSYMDLIDADWATVQYRACAVDNNGAKGPYAETETFTLNNDYIMISGPDSELGTRNGPFALSVVIGVSGENGSSVKQISVSVSLDGTQFYTGSRDAGQNLVVVIDTRFLKTGRHTIEIAAEKGAYMPAQAAFVFELKTLDMSLVANAQAGIIQNDKGEAKLPYTFAQMVIVDETGKTLADVLAELAADDGQPEEPATQPSVQIASGTYIGTGTYGSSNPNRLQLEFAPKFLVVAPQEKTSSGIESGSDYGIASTPFIVWAGQPGSASSQGSGYVQSANNKVSVSGNSVSWYSDISAEYQLNNRISTYYYFAIGMNST